MSVVVNFLEDWRVFKIPISCFPMKSVKTRLMSVVRDWSRFGSEERVEWGRCMENIITYSEAALPICD